MEIIDPTKLRLHPGQSMQAAVTREKGDNKQVGFFLRSEFGAIRRNGDLVVEQRAGVIRFNDVMLVLTMIKVVGVETELFDIWWNFRSHSLEDLFQLMSRQERFTLYFYDAAGKDFDLVVDNEFRRFFASLPPLMERSPEWSEAEFDRAVRGLCAQSYPKENLWDMIHASPPQPETREGQPGLDDYEGHIPEELQPFYTYAPELGHAIAIIPSALEEEAVEGETKSYLYPAPVQTVLRCGVRWVKGYPVAPIPFIPGHGLAVPPEDSEL
jgi:hypothetical protein